MENVKEHREQDLGEKLSGLCKRVENIAAVEQDEQLIDRKNRIYVSSNGRITRKINGKTEVICGEAPTVYDNLGIFEIKEKEYR